jgi:radical SAM superfamily enzyme YgiQ (UPF0313 family)
MKIYLADLFHVYQADRNPDTNPYTVPLGIGFLASTTKVHLPSAEVRLFRNPDRLLAAVRATPPDILGLSFCSWNSDLSHRVSEIVKRLCPDILIVGGGPSVDDADDQIIDFFRMFPTLDYIVPNEGESGFLELVKALAAKQRMAGAISGVTYLNDLGNLVRGEYKRPVVPGRIAGVERISPKQERIIRDEDVQIPSPYLDGTLDEFLDEGLVPIIQTMRGCPYQCHFCVSGATEWNRMRGFDLDRVKAEIDYALSRSRAKDLILTDENWGILGERDVELARFIMERHRTQGAPTRLYYYTAKIVTPASKEIVELVAPIAWIGEFSMSFQSLNPQTRQAIKRTNISMDKLAANVQWARERNIMTSSEMIYGFPYETPESFFTGVERLVREGVSSVTIYPLQLFPGIDLAAKRARQDYAIRTRFRLADGGYGIYDNGNLIAAETEEIVIANKWSTEDDYFTIRRYGFFQQAILGRSYLVEFIRLCSEMNISAEGVVRQLATADYSHYPTLAAILAEHRRDAEAELKHSRAEAHAELSERLLRNESSVGVKLNLVSLGKLMSSEAAVRELVEIVRGHFDRVLHNGIEREIALTYLDEVLPNRIVVLNANVQEQVYFVTRFNYEKWASHEHEDISELIVSEPRMMVGTISDVLKKNLIGFDSNSRFDLQSIFDRTPSRQLLRSVTPELGTPHNVGRSWRAHGTAATGLNGSLSSPV